MIPLASVESSNRQISTSLPETLVAVFVGATNGIGELTLKRFAKHARKPRVYFIGRSQEAGDRIAGECTTINPAGEFHFIQADVSQIMIVDEVCRNIRGKEKFVNVLFLNQGSLAAGIKTAEGLHLSNSLTHYSRSRFAINLLSLLQAAPTLRRVVSVFAGTKEGPVKVNDPQGWNVPILSARGHFASQVTISMEVLAKMAPTVGFVHAFPGPVKTGIGREAAGVFWSVFGIIFMLVGRFVYMDPTECGERHLFAATSDRFKAREGGENGVKLIDSIKVARGTDGTEGGGVYSIDQRGETAGSKVEKLLENLRKDGTAEKVWEDLMREYTRITGLESIEEEVAGKARAVL